MAVTTNTIPSQNGTIVRALVTAGQGGNNSSPRNWLNQRGSNDVGSISGDIFIGTALGSMDRIMWHTSNQLRVFSSTNAWIAAIAAGGLLEGKSILLAFNETDPPIDVQLDAADATAVNPHGRFPANAAAQVFFDAVAVGDLINVVIADTPSSVVDIDTAAAIAAGAPTVAADAEIVPAPIIRETAAEVEAGAPTVDVTAEKVDIQQPFHDIDAEVEAGAPGPRCRR